METVLPDLAARGIQPGIDASGTRGLDKSHDAGKISRGAQVKQPVKMVRHEYEAQAVDDTEIMLMPQCPYDQAAGVKVGEQLKLLMGNSGYQVDMIRQGDPADAQIVASWPGKVIIHDPVPNCSGVSMLAENLCTGTFLGQKTMRDLESRSLRSERITRVQQHESALAGDVSGRRGRRKSIHGGLTAASLLPTPRRPDTSPVSGYRRLNMAGLITNQASHD